MIRKILSLVMALLLVMTFLPVTAGAAASDLSITINDGDTTAVPGTSQTYTIVVSNTSSNDMEYVAVYCTLPPDKISNLPTPAAWTVDPSYVADPSFGTVSASYTSDYTPAENFLTYVNLPAGASVTFMLTVNIISSATGNLDVSVRASIGMNSVTATDTDTLKPQADLSVAINDDISSLAPGNVTIYTVNVTNTGHSDVGNISLSCPLPEGATEEYSYWYCDYNTSTGTVSSNPSRGDGALDTKVYLPRGSVCTFKFVVNTDPAAAGSLVTTAEITPPTETDPNILNNSATDTDTLVPEADLEVWVGFGDQTGNKDNEVTLNVGVHNYGPSVATGVALSTTLPAGVTIVSAVPDQGNYDPATGVWTIGTVEYYNSTKFLEIKATVDYSASAEPQTISVSVSHSDVTDSELSNNDDSLVINDRADVAVTASVVSPTPNMGDIVTITVTLTNNGPDEATDIWVAAPLPSGLAYESDNPSTGNYYYDDEDDGDCGWEVDSLESGSSVTLEIQASVSSPGVKAFSAQVESDLPDPDMSNNSASAAVTPIPIVHSITVQDDGHGTGAASPASAAAGTAVTLSASPNSGYHFKEWQVVSPAGITITGNTLTMPDENATVKAVFEADTATVTFSSNGSTHAARTVNTGESIGSAAWPSDPTRADYTFGGWYTGENGSGTQFASTTPVNANIIVYAKWTSNGGGGGGTPSTPSTPNYKADVNAGSGLDTTLQVTVDKNSGNASVDVGTGSNLMFGGKSTTITVPTVPDVDTYTLGLPVPNLTTPDEQGEIAFKTDNGIVTVPSNMLTDVEGISGSKAQISIGRGDKDNLSDDVKAAIGDRPLIQLTLSIDGTQTNWSNPSAAVTVSIPYTPTADELKNPESIVIWYIDGSGNVVTIPNGHYDPATGMVTFDTTHFSDYAIAYNKVSFNDVTEDAWYNKAVSFIAAREITSGTGSGNYSPDAKLTRGEFIVLMMRAYGIAPDTNPTDNFSDAGNTYYTGYLAAAKRLGITSGVGNNMYAPSNQITRQEMFTLLYNALKVISLLPQGNSGKTILDFSDATQMSSWAQDAMMLLVKTGTVGGSNGKLTPTGTTTRAEMAQVLYNLLGK